MNKDEKLQQELNRIYKYLLHNTVKLDEESQKLLYDNLWDLYAEDPNGERR